jgi:hypothetical protein
MNRLIRSLAIVCMLALPVAAPAFAQQPAAPPPGGHGPHAPAPAPGAPPAPGPGGMMGGMDMMGMCRMMMGGGMGMPGGPQDPKLVGRMLQMRGEMMKAVGDVLIKHGKAIESEAAKK